MRTRPADARPVRNPRRITHTHRPHHRVHAGCAHHRTTVWEAITEDRTSRVLTAVLTVATAMSVGIAYLMLRTFVTFALWLAGVV